MFPWRSVLFSSLLSGVALGDDTLRRLTRPDAIEALASTLDRDALAAGLAARESHLRADADATLAGETLDLLAPLADRLGLGPARARLEDASFRVVAPEAFRALDADAARQHAALDQLLADTERRLADTRVAATVSGRVKSSFSTWQKMQRKGVGADRIYDRVALRIVADDETTLRRALDDLHSRYAAVPGEFDDYIRSPKPSGYQALHTAVATPYGVAEFQLRTRAMDAAAEAGDQAHWRYKLSA